MFENLKLLIEFNLGKYWQQNAGGKLSAKQIVSESSEFDPSYHFQHQPIPIGRVKIGQEKGVGKSL